jgi:hypothetical protein
MNERADALGNLKLSNKNKARGCVFDVPYHGMHFDSLPLSFFSSFSQLRLPRCVAAAVVLVAAALSLLPLATPSV